MAVFEALQNSVEFAARPFAQAYAEDFQFPECRKPGKFCAEHFGHCTIDGGVIGIWRTPPIICDQLQEGKHVRRDLGEIVAAISYAKIYTGRIPQDCVHLR